MVGEFWGKGLFRFCFLVVAASSVAVVILDIFSSKGEPR